MTKTIKSDPSLGMPVAALGNQKTYEKLVKEQTKAQEDACSTVIEASDRIPGIEAMTPNITDPNSSMKGEGPVKGYHKAPEMKVYSQAETDLISHNITLDGTTSPRALQKATLKPGASKANAVPTKYN